jgi:mRNA interferase RelE/StbE
MRYDVRFKPRAIKDIEGLPSRVQGRVLARIEKMRDELKGDVKRLTNFTREYRLRIGDFRVLFEIERETIIIYRIRHRREAYRWREVDEMVSLRAQIIKKNGKREYAVLPYEEFLRIQEELEDYADLRCLREAKEMERDAPTIGLAEWKKKIGRRTIRSSRRR